MPEQPNIMAFATAAEFRQWLTRHHAEHPGIWLKIARKASGILMRRSSFPASDDPQCLEKTKQWLVELRAVDADVAQHAHGIMERHFAAANLPVRGGGEKPTTWWSFCWSLYLHLSPLLKDRAYDSMVRALLGELVELALCNPDGDPATRLAEMWERFLDTDPPRSRFQALLSATALAHLEAVQGLLEARAEEERRRLDQSGY